MPSVLCPHLFLRREMRQGVRLALDYKLHRCRGISHPCLLPWASRKMGPCFLLEKHDDIWYSCCLLSGWLLQVLFCPEISLFSSTQTQSVCLQWFPVLDSLPAAGAEKDFFHQEKYGMSFFTLYRRSDLGVSIKKTPTLLDECYCEQECYQWSLHSQ